MTSAAATLRAIIVVQAVLISGSSYAAEQVEFSIYGGLQSIGDSQVSGNDPGGTGIFNFVTGWPNRPGGALSQFGLRLTVWQNCTFGWGMDFNSYAARADQSTLGSNGISALELSNGINILTINAYRRWQDIGIISPYVGAGVGVAIPTIKFDSGTGRTSQLQLTGPAMQWVAGASIPVGNGVSVFGEYQGSYTVYTANLIGGGSFSTNLRRSTVNFGLSLGF